MTAPTELPDLSRTAVALEAHDRALEALRSAADQSIGIHRLRALDAEVDRLAAVVGAAYGLDTADRNDPQTCADHIRPGPPTPPPGATLSFVRRMVTQWREQSGA